MSGAVVQHEGRRAGSPRRQRLVRIGATRPEIIDAGDEQPVHIQRFIAQHANPCLRHAIADFVRDLRLAPGITVVVIAQYREGQQAAARHLRQMAFQLRQLTHSAPRHPVAGVGHDVGGEVARGAPHALQVPIVDGRPDVQVAEVEQCTAIKRRRQPRNGQVAARDFEPDWLQPMRVRRHGTETGTGGPQKIPSIHSSRIRRIRRRCRHASPTVRRRRNCRTARSPNRPAP